MSVVLDADMDFDGDGDGDVDLAVRALTLQPSGSTFAPIARAVRQRRIGQVHVAVAVKVHVHDQD